MLFGNGRFCRHAMSIVTSEWKYTRSVPKKHSSLGCINYHFVIRDKIFVRTWSIQSTSFGLDFLLYSIKYLTTDSKTKLVFLLIHIPVDPPRFNIIQKKFRRVWLLVISFIIENKNQKTKKEKTDVSIAKISFLPLWKLFLFNVKKTKPILYL